MYNILIPKLNPNDNACIMTAWSVADGAWIHAGTVLAVVETSKAAMDLVAEVDGLLLRDIEEGQEAQVGQSIGYLFPDAAARDAFLDHRTRTASAMTNLRITRKARDLMDRYRLTEGDLAGLDKSIIRESDVLTLLETRTNAPDQDTMPTPVQTALPSSAVELTRHQQAIARTVATSRREIPDAFLVIKVDCEQALRFLAATRTATGMHIGLLEALVWQAGRLWSRHPQCFGTAIDEHRVLPATAAHIGVTLDQGHGLFVPVVRNADQQTLEQIANTLDEYRYNTFRGEFEESALSDGVFSVALITEPDVVFSMPVILPGQVCMVSLCAVVEELVLDGGEVRVRRVTHLGLAYDHRFINGREASAFCRDLKNAIEHLGEDYVGR